MELFETTLKAGGGIPEIQFKQVEIAVAKKREVETALTSLIMFTKVEPNDAAFLECRVSGAEDASRVELKLTVRDDNETTNFLCLEAINKYVPSLLAVIMQRSSMVF
jgi:hypothetical protein